MLKEAIYHDFDSGYVYALAEDKFLVKIRCKKNDLEKVNVYYFDKYRYLDGKKNKKSVKMEKATSDTLFDYYEAILDYNINNVQYYFELKDKIELLYYGNYRFFEKSPKKVEHTFNFPVLAKEDIFQIPEWSRDAIVYHIFPDRFNKGEEKLSDNYPDWYGDVNNEIILGGTIKGILEKIDYLKELGINTLYLNPIFKSYSNHKYDTVDYYEIDENFGTKEDFKLLVEKLHNNNMKIIIDGVFNHSGLEFFAFNDLLEKKEQSQYKDWYTVHKFPINLKAPMVYFKQDYKAYADYYKMPKFVHGNEEVKEYLIKVGEYWIKEFDIDGWRLDVADEISHEFWREFRKRVKLIKPDILLIGEVWHNASPWLRGEQFDTVLNYVFREAVLRFVCQNEINPQEFSEQIGFLRSRYRKQPYEIMFNILGGHDTPRVLNECNGDVNKLKLAVMFQFMFTGIPMIYYGDEVGMDGWMDPDCRKGMLWKEELQNRNLLEYYKKLIKIRKEKKAVTYGKFKEIVIDNEKNIYGYSKTTDNEEIYVYVNNSKEEQKIKLNSKMINLLTGAKVEKEIIIPPKEGLILEKAKMNFFNFRK